ncbi:MAG: hypothetical protein KDN05_09735 [Verrucomicrobiae bacterium]|nr:hypothetical protein [Verrucomicrobiae bacterium]
MSWWQKLLSKLGLYTPPAAPARAPKQAPAPAAKSPGSEPRPAKSNTRNARTDGRTESEKPDSRSSKRSRSGGAPKPRGGDGSSVESSRVYVGNLSYDVSEQDLQELFKGIGGVRNVEIVYNRSTHRSKGYGFVEMLHKDEAVRAVEVLHDQPFMGRKMIVSGAKSKGQDDREDQDGRDETPQKPVELAPLPEKPEPAETPAAEAEPKIETVVEQTAETAPATEAPAAEAKPETADDLVAKYGFDEEPKKDQDA